MWRGWLSAFHCEPTLCQLHPVHNQMSAYYADGIHELLCRILTTICWNSQLSNRSQIHIFQILVVRFSEFQLHIENIKPQPEFFLSRSNARRECGHLQQPSHFTCSFSPLPPPPLNSPALHCPAFKTLLHTLPPVFPCTAPCNSHGPHLVFYFALNWSPLPNTTPELNCAAVFQTFTSCSALHTAHMFSFDKSHFCFSSFFNAFLSAHGAAVKFTRPNF